MESLKILNGSIYKICSPNTSKFYIGSSCIEDINKRLTQHKQAYNQYIKNNKNYITCFEILKEGDPFIEVIEKFNCNTKTELRNREGELIRLYKDDVVNKKIENRTYKEWIEQHKPQVNKSKLKYYYNNKEKFIIYRQKKNILKLKEKLNETKERVDIATNLLLSIKDI